MEQVCTLVFWLCILSLKFTYIACCCSSFSLLCNIPLYMNILQSIHFSLDRHVLALLSINFHEYFYVFGYIYIYLCMYFWIYMQEWNYFVYMCLTLIECFKNFSKVILIIYTHNRKAWRRKENKEGYWCWVNQCHSHRVRTLLEPSWTRHLYFVLHYQWWKILKLSLCEHMLPSRNYIRNCAILISFLLI